MRSLPLLLLVCLIGACRPVASGTPTPALAAGAPCPLTPPPPVAATPPPTVGTGPNSGLVFRAGPDSFLYGNEALVVILANDGTIHPSDPSRGLPGGVKFPWYRIAHGDLTIATRRLDAATAAQAADVPGGYGDSGFVPSGLNFASAGCWEVTGTISGKTLTFVVNVAER